jgi:DNA polymerase IV
LGEDDRPLELRETTKSISSETTFLEDTEDRPRLRATLREQAAEIAKELTQKHLLAKTVQVRVRYGDFTTLTRQITLEEPIGEARAIYRLGCYLLAWHKLVTRPLRLLGLGVSNLGPPSQQLRLPLDV